MSVNPGEPAPDFVLKSHLDREVKLSDYRGKKHVVLVFYPLDFSPVCSIQLPEYSERKAEFDALDAEVLGVNRDSIYTHKAWAREFGITVPLLADMTGAVAKAYGVYLDERGIAQRAVFIIDKEGIVRFKHAEAQTGDFTLHADDLLAELRKLAAP